MNCTRCSRPMRKTRDLAADHPGTVCYGSRNLCARCYKAARAAQTLPPLGTRGFKEAKAIDAAPANTASLTAYLEWRRPYRVKAGTS